MRKPFTDLENALYGPHHQIADKKMKLLHQAILIVGKDEISGVKARGKDKITVYTFLPPTHLPIEPRTKCIRWRQDSYYQEEGEG
jgi:hypothetical protein|tara:strand:- start:228 stop:482 length:255 start_codon:yes stop_codon:yes gene_type:complete